MVEYCNFMHYHDLTYIDSVILSNCGDLSSLTMSFGLMALEFFLSMVSDLIKRVTPYPSFDNIWEILATNGID